jgi:peptidyl-prolyl cis-trans isomerase SurA
MSTMTLTTLRCLARPQSARLAAAGLAMALATVLAAAPAQAFKAPTMDGAAPAIAQPPPPQVQQAPKKKKKQAAPKKPAKPTAPRQSKSSTSQSIVALVNDEPITGYEIDQRMRLSLLGSAELQQRMQKQLKSKDMDAKFKKFALKRLKANPPKSQEEQQQRVKQLQAQFVQTVRRQVESDYLPDVRKAALDELIEERLKMQEAKRLSAIAETAEVDRVIKGMAERNKLTPEELAQQVSKSGANVKEMRLRIKASLSWAAVIRQRFGRQIALSANDLERVVTSVGGPADVELNVQRILLPLPADVTQQRVAQRLGEAERLRMAYTGCGGMSGLAAQVTGARFDDLGDRPPSSIEEPTRSMLLAANDGEMLPPTVNDGGVELWAMCGRKAVKAAAKSKSGGNDQIRQKEFEILSKKHLKDLRQDAHIEYRG